jgi:hypothetical protein
MRTKLVVAAVAITLAAASCSSSRSTKPSVSATATTTTTTPTPETVAPEPTTTERTTRSIVTAKATTTTTTPTQAVEAEIRAAVQRNKEAYRSCVHEPSSCDLSSTMTGAQLATSTSFVAEKLVALGRRVDFDESDPAFSVVSSIVVADDGLSAEYDVCTWDTGITVQALPDTEVIVVDDLKGTIRKRETVELVEGRWLMAESVKTGPTVIGRNDCGPRP